MGRIVNSRGGDTIIKAFLHFAELRSDYKTSVLLFIGEGGSLSLQMGKLKRKAFNDLAQSPKDTKGQKIAPEGE